MNIFRKERGEKENKQFTNLSFQIYKNFRVAKKNGNEEKQKRESITKAI